MTKDRNEPNEFEESQVEQAPEDAAEAVSGDAPEEAMPDVAEETATDAAEGAPEGAQEKKTGWTVVAAAIIAALLALCTIVICTTALTALFAGGQAEDSVSGTVTYRERIALPPDAVVSVQIRDVSLADAPAQVMGEQIIENPGQVPIPYDVAYDPNDIDERHTYAAAARIVDGSGKLLFITTTIFPVITRGNPTEDVQLLVERVEEAPPPEPTVPPIQSYILIDEPVQGEVVDIGQAVRISGEGAGLPEGNVVVQVMDRSGNLVAEQATVLQGENVGTGGKGTWSVELNIEAEPGTAGTISAFSLSPLDDSTIAADQVQVSLGRTAAVPVYIEIDSPAEGAELDTSQPVLVSGTGAGLPEANVVVQALDASDNVLAETATILQGPDVGIGGPGTWQVELLVGVPTGTPGRIVAFSPSPLTGENVASAVVRVTFGQGLTLEGTTWAWDQSLPGQDITALFENGQLSGFAGCNNYRGSYVTTSTAGRNMVEIGPLATTRMACEQAIMDLEDKYLTALQSATSYRLEGFALEITYPGGTLLYYDQEGARPRR
jgi:putative lipoprotein